MASGRDHLETFLRTMRIEPFYANARWQTDLVETLGRTELDAAWEPVVRGDALVLPYAPLASGANEVLSLTVHGPGTFLRSRPRRLPGQPDHRWRARLGSFQRMGRYTRFSIDYGDQVLEAGEAGVLGLREPWWPMMPYLKLSARETRASIVRPADPMSDTIPLFLSAVRARSLETVRWNLPARQFGSYERSAS